MQVQIGDEVIRRPVTFWDGLDALERLMRGRVVYVHPAGRYHTVAFELPGGVLRESFQGVER